MRNSLVVLILVFGWSILTVSPVSAEWKAYNLDTSPVDEYKWDRTEKILFGTFVTVLVIDLIQTQYIFKHDEYRELNPIINAIGPEWTPLYYATRVAAIWWVADVYPSGRQRKTILCLVDAINIVLVGHNYYIGIKLSF